MKSTLKFIPLMMLFAFLITCNNIQANLSETENPLIHGKEIFVAINPNEAKMNEAVIFTIELNEKHKAVNLVGIELWRVEDESTGHQRMDVRRKKDGKFEYKTYFDMPGTYQINVHVLINGVRKVTSETFTVSI